MTPWTAAHQTSLSITNSRSLHKFMSIELMMPSNHLILCRPLLLPPSVFPSIRVFSNESVLHIRWPKYWSFSFSIIPSKEISGLISFRMDWWVASNNKGIFLIHATYSSCLVAKSCPTLCDPMDCSLPGLPVHHQLPELTQTHVH